MKDQLINTRLNYLNSRLMFKFIYLSRKRVDVG